MRGRNEMFTGSQEGKMMSFPQKNECKRSFVRTAVLQLYSSLFDFQDLQSFVQSGPIETSLQILKHPLFTI